MTDVTANDARAHVAWIRDNHLRAWVCRHKWLLLAGVVGLSVFFGCWIVVLAGILAATAEVLG